MTEPTDPLANLRALSEAADDSPEDRDAFTIAAVDLVRRLLEPEAVERMARAIAEDVHGEPNDPTSEAWREFEPEAQAALAALLNGEKS